MKKIVVILLLLLFIPMGFADVTRQQSANGVVVDWVFKPEVSTYMGVNLDQGFFGMEGKARFTAKTTIRQKATEEFVSENTNGIYAQVEVKDLEIRFDTFDQNQDRDDRELNDDGTYDDGGKPYSYGDGENDVYGAPLLIKWGEINATVYFGPVYLQLKAKEHDEVNFVDNFDDNDFTTMRYDIIEPAHTARHADSVYSKDGVKNTNKSYVVENLVTTNGNLGAMAVGFKLDNLFDIKLGFSAQYSYDQVMPLSLDYNPMAFSLAFDLLAVENLTLKAKLGFITGRENRDVLEQDNPISVGALVGYTLPLGDIQVQPVAGIDLAFENRFVNPGLTDDNSSKLLTVPLELGVGVRFLWTDRGITATDQDVFEGGDFEATDGAGIGFLYGRAPFSYLDGVETALPETDTDYIGVKLSLWESEGTNTPGIVPGFAAAFITNINYVFGQTLKVKPTVPVTPLVNGETKLNGQLDIGLGLDASYAISFVRPKLGLIYKAFNVMDSKLVDGANPFGLARVGVNDQDLRLKIGLDIIQIIPNTTLEVLWLSGDLLRIDEGEFEVDRSDPSGLGDDDFFSNETGSNKARNFASNAYFGYIKLGAKVSF